MKAFNRLHANFRNRISEEAGAKLPRRRKIDTHRLNSREEPEIRPEYEHQMLYIYLACSWPSRRSVADVLKDLEMIVGLILFDYESFPKDGTIYLSSSLGSTNPFQIYPSLPTYLTSNGWSSTGPTPTSEAHIYSTFPTTSRVAVISIPRRFQSTEGSTTSYSLRQLPRK